MTPCMKYKMLVDNRIDISEGIDVNKTSASKECDICHYWYFKDISFKYEPYLCNGCHDLMQKAMSFNDVAIVYVKGNAYIIHFWYMSKDEAIIIMNNSNSLVRMISNKFRDWSRLSNIRSYSILLHKIGITLRPFCGLT